MLEFKDIRVHDILQKDGVMWNVVAVLPDKVVLQRTVETMDLRGWEKVDAYQLSGKR